MDGWTKIKQASVYAGVSERTFRGWLKQGLKHSRLPSGTVLIRHKEIDAYLNRFTVDQSEIDRIVGEVTRKL